MRGARKVPRNAALDEHHDLLFDDGRDEELPGLRVVVDVLGQQSRIGQTEPRMRCGNFRLVARNLRLQGGAQRLELCRVQQWVDLAHRDKSPCFDQQPLGIGQISLPVLLSLVPCQVLIELLKGCDRVHGLGIRQRGSQQQGRHKGQWEHPYQYGVAGRYDLAGDIRFGTAIGMNQKAALLSQLRIDRSETPEDPEAGKRRRWLMAIGALIVLAIVVASWWYVSASSRVNVHTVVAKAVPGASAGSAPAGGSLLDASGYVVALREATVSGKAIYKVIEVLVQEGQAVKEGEILARLDDTNTRAALEQSRAQVTQLDAALSAARIAADDARPVYLR